MQHVPWWLDTRHVREEAICYPTRTLALRVFKEANRGAIDRAGGMDQISTDGSWDPINESTGRKGERKVRTVREAIEAAMPPGRPWCLDRIDLETLNECRPIAEAGGLTLPDFVEEQRHVKKLEDEYAAMRDEYADAAREEFAY
jgi:hypothetical protein